MPLSSLLVEAYALVREASERMIGLRPFNVQVLAAIALHEGKIVEMNTGEGKTLAAVMPAYLNALTGKGIHILTFNDYLAHRDAAWMGPIYEFLGLSVGYIQEGMTATAQPAAKEFFEFYGLPTVPIPPHKPCLRTDYTDLIFTHCQAKLKALIKEIKESKAKGRPVLIGTASVDESEDIASALRSKGIECQVLNAKNDEQEAKMIAQAGRPGAVTVATNMAGRGTDIKLGGTNEEERQKVVKLGGLYVIGTNRHESLRIDYQLRGRAGRQGDPGSSRFFISLEDKLIRDYGINNLWAARYQLQKHEAPIKYALIRREITRSQRIIEGRNFDIRKKLWKYSVLLEEQRKIIQSEILKSFYSLPWSEIKKEEINLDLKDFGVKGLSSTWTYLIEDNQLGLWVGLLQAHNIGLTATAAAVYGSLYLALTILQRYWPKCKLSSKNKGADGQN